MVNWDVCQYREPVKKPTSLLTNFEVLSALEVFCRGGHSHDPLYGQIKVFKNGVGKWKNRTSLVGAYGKALCRRWASLVRSAAPTDLFGDSAPWVLDWVHSISNRGSNSTNTCTAEADDTQGLEPCAEARGYLATHSVKVGGGRVAGRNQSAPT